MTADLLVGRTRELADLEQRVAAAVAGDGHVVLVEGDAGVGKTSLAAAVVRYAHQTGVPTAWGACLEGEGAAPYRPWLQVLKSLGLPASRLGESDRNDNASRFQVFDETVQLLSDAADRSGLLVVIDDIHWADMPSIRLLQFAAAAAADTHLLLVGLYRAGEAYTHAGLAGVLPEIARERAANQVLLGGLSASEVEELATHTLSRRPDEALLRAVTERAEGNPLFTVELLKLAQAAGSEGTGLPRGIHQVIRQRLDDLPEKTRQAVVQASVLGREFPVKLLGELIGDNPLDTIGDAITAGIVLPAQGHVLRFDHALTQEVAYAELPLTDRQALHATAASAIALSHGDVDALAHHLRQAAPLGKGEEALDATLQAAERARSQLAHEHAAYQYRAARDLLPLVTDSPIRPQDLLLDAARCEFRSGAVEDAWRSCREAADLGRADEDAATVADAATVLRGIANSSVTTQMHALCREALTILRGTDQVREARVLAQLAVTVDPFAREIEPDLGERAMRAAEATGDPDARFLALQARRTELTDIRYSQERLTLGERAIHLGREVGRAEYVAWGHTWRMDAFWELSRRVQLDAELAAFTTVVEHMKEPLWRWRLTMTRASLALEEGRFADARHSADEALVIGRRGRHEGAEFLHLVYHDHLGQLTGSGMEPVEEAVRRFAESAPFLARSWHAHVLMSQGRIDEAAKLWHSIVPHLDGFPRRAREWIVATSGHADLCAGLGDRGVAPSVYADLLPYRALQVTGGAETPSRGPVALYLGKLAAMLEDWDTAETHLGTALELSTAMGARPHEARTHLEIGRLMLGRRQARDVRTGNTHLQIALDIARELGMRSVERDATSLLGKGPDGESPLSRREEEVAALVADGLSNRQIARRLHLSERTAENHVTHILNKLGFDSRARIAAWYTGRNRED